MKTVFKAFVLIYILILPLVLYSQEPVSNIHETALSKLKSYLKKRGYNAETIFSNPKFEIYDDIDDFFNNSAERNGYRNYSNARKTGGKEEGESVFREELIKYKMHIGYEKKKNKLIPFMGKYDEALEFSELEYGVPKELTAAVIGVESVYGTITGRHLAANVYISMYVKNYRTKWALEQLDELIRFSRKYKFDIYSFNSSYAGAIGYMQFLPWSLNRWFVGDDVTDMNDCIVSAANYLAHYRKTHGTLEKAVYSYNPSRLYVQTVLDLAEYGTNAMKSTE